MAGYLSASMKSVSSSRGSSTNISQAIRRTSSAFSHRVSKNLAAVAVDVVGYFGDHTTPALGDTHSDLKPRIGNKKYDAMCAGDLPKLVNITYCQRALEVMDMNKDQLVDASGEKDLSDAVVEDVKEIQKRGLINHDFLVLEIQPGNGGENFYILAEKLRRDEEGRVGIFVTYRSKGDAPCWYNKDTKLYTVFCRMKQIALNKLEKVLLSADPNYCLQGNNCWEYAMRTVQNLLLELAEDCKTSEAEIKTKLLEEYTNLEANLNDSNIKNHWEDIKNWFSRTFSS
ncbi:hypothetical protein M758_6G059500 [Ceratodon purpureus]|nr:hypothetical protein M758_6G059500 [Ceratodon purpureus]